jgi:hypothetical protein
VTVLFGLVVPSGLVMVPVVTVGVLVQGTNPPLTPLLLGFTIVGVAAAKEKLGNIIMETIENIIINFFISLL